MSFLKRKIKPIYYSALFKVSPNRYKKPVYYYTSVDNIGDRLNEDLFHYISGCEIHTPRGYKYMGHILAVGSVISYMNRYSTVWGSGMISEDALNGMSEVGDIRAIRGYMTKAALEAKFSLNLNDTPLGDPALLMPKFIEPSKKKLYSFGYVPHYVDKEHKLKNVVEALGGILIDVGLETKDFIEKLTSCEKIISSSMHGLILSDAYNIPNRRVILSDKIYGGNFKFKDYYSTTINPEELGVEVEEEVSVGQLEDILSSTKVNKTTLDLDKLLSAFPYDVI